MTSSTHGARKQVYLHIGAMKTGTSYVQGNLDHARRALAEAGVLYPGAVGAAVHEVLEKHGARHFGDTSGAWDDLAATVRAWAGPSVIVSMEFLTLATTAQATRIVESVQPADVRIVLTARDLTRTIPSAWQQTTKNRQTATWPEFLAAITLAEDAGARIREQFWRHHGIAEIARTWSDVVGPDQLTIVTLPPAGSEPELLWERFCVATGLDSASYSVAEDGRWNASLGFAEAEMMRRLNIELGRAVDQVAYRRWVTGMISRHVLRRGGEPTPAPKLPPEVHEWAVHRSQEMVTELKELDVPVVGDLNELVAPALGEADLVPYEFDEAEVSAAAIRVAAALVSRLAESTEEGPRGPRGGQDARRRRTPRAVPASGDSVGTETDARATARAERRAARRASRQGPADRAHAD